jgi:hypothetical protein
LFETHIEKRKGIKKEINMVHNDILIFVFVCLNDRWQESSDRNEVIYFLPPLAATAADLVTLPDAAAFFSTSFITPTATV